jgi:protocatechuate 3,4-dioxygenase, beta subunit
MIVSRLNRRYFLQGLTAAAMAAFTTRGVFAQQLVETGTTTEGPFYPDKLPLDTDNDLLIINDAITPAVGEITHLTGHVFTKSGQPVRNAFVEIWQVDHTGSTCTPAADSRAGSTRTFRDTGASSATRKASTTSARSNRSITP